MSNFIHIDSIMFRCLWLHQEISTVLGLVLKTWRNKLKAQNRSQFDFPKFLKNKQERGKTRRDSFFFYV